MSKVNLYLGDCFDILQGFSTQSVDAIVTDPPYGIRFMGKKWDCDIPSIGIWTECLRVLKPGGHLLVFAGTRTQHRMATRIEDAGFEIRDMIAWVYGSGFPKSLDVSKAIDKAAGAEREVIGQSAYAARRPRKEYEPEQKWGATLGGSDTANITAPATEAAKQWDGWGTALKPALEPITVARKPLIGTVAENVLTHGTGAINVDGCRVGNDKRYTDPARNTNNPHTATGPAQSGGFGMGPVAAISTVIGRWPANLIHDGSEEFLKGFPGENKSAARFFYVPKASKKDRNDHNEYMPDVINNNHPTVKPTDLMRYLCRLITPPNGIVLDPFMGSGSTGKAAILEGFNFIGCEISEEYFRIAKARIDAAYQKLELPEWLK